MVVYFRLFVATDSCIFVIVWVRLAIVGLLFCVCGLCGCLSMCESCCMGLGVGVLVDGWVCEYV